MKSYLTSLHLTGLMLDFFGLLLKLYKLLSFERNYVFVVGTFQD